MRTSAGYRWLGIALAVAVGVIVGRWASPDRIEPDRPQPAKVVVPPTRLGPGIFMAQDATSTTTSPELEQRLQSLAAKLSVEAAERRRLEQRIDALAGELASVRRPDAVQMQSAAAAPKPPASAAAHADPAAAPIADATDDPGSSMERALVAAGLDRDTAGDIKRRQDELTMAEIYLRDTATREGWMNTPQFNDENARLEQQRTSIRDQIGDDAYDRYLAALNEPNRVAVQDVLADSPAAAAGLQPGDLVVRYGDARIFSPGDLVTATGGGTAGENVQVEVIRQGQRLQIEVPRGPLGVQIAASHGDPGQG